MSLQVSVTPDQLRQILREELRPILREELAPINKRLDELTENITGLREELAGVIDPKYAAAALKKSVTD